MEYPKVLIINNPPDFGLAAGGAVEAVGRLAEETAEDSSPVRGAGMGSAWSPAPSSSPLPEISRGSIHVNGLRQLLTKGLAF
jgi:hypothetical protein